MVLKRCSRKFQKSFKDVSSVFQESSKGISKMFQGGFKGRLKGVSTDNSVGFKGI